MDELERYLNAVCRGLRVSPALRHHIRDELQAHLLDSVQEHVGAGMSREDAVAGVLDEFGKAETIRGELKAVYGGGLMTVLIQQAMEWKEKTMKSDWKWSFVAHLAVAAVLAIGCLAFMSWMRFIVPLSVEAHVILDAPLTHLGGFGPRLIGSWEFFARTWLLWAALALAAWGAFERFCKSENKRIIRLALGASACVVTTVLVCVFGTAMMIMHVDLIKEGLVHDFGDDILRNARKAEASFAELSEAVDGRDWPGVERASWGLRRSLEGIARQGEAATTLASLDEWQDLDEIRQLLGSALERSRDLFRASRSRDHGELLDGFSRLSESYEALKAKTGGWPGTAMTNQE
jgi:hypothetical protein